jgi:rod shape-determining protein MreD
VPGAPIFVAILVMAVLAVVQASVLPRVPIVGIVPQLSFLVALVWGHLRGLEEGLIWAFIAGLFVDLFSLAPLGISSLAFMAGVGLPILLGRILPPRRLLIVVLQAALGTLIYLAVYAVALRVFGHGVSPGGLFDLLPLIGLHAVLVVPIYLLLSTILRAVKPRRVEF